MSFEKTLSKGERLEFGALEVSKEAGKCIVVGESLIGLQAALILRAIGVRVLWISSPSGKLCSSYISGSVFWESSSRTDWNYLGLLRPLLDLWSSPEISEFSKSLPENRLKVGWFDSFDHVLTEHQGSHRGPSGEGTLYDEDSRQLILRLLAVGAEMNRWTVKWLGQLGWQSQQATQAWMRRETRAKLRRDRIARKKGRLAGQEEPVPSHSGATATSRAEGWKSDAKILLVDFARQLAAAVDAFRRSGDRLEPKTAHKNILVGVERKVAGRKFTLARSQASKAWMGKAPSNQLAHRALELRKGVDHYRGLVSFEQFCGNDLGEIQVAESLAGLGGGGHLGGVSPFWKPSQLSEQRSAELRGLAKNAGIEVIEFQPSSGTARPEVGLELMKSRDGEFSGIRILSTKQDSREVLGEQLVIADLEQVKLLKDGSGALEQRQVFGGEVQKIQRVCTLALDFGLLEIPDLPRIRCQVGGLSAELEWYDRAGFSPQAKGMTLYVRFEIPEGADTGSESCRKAALEALALLKAEFPGQFSHPHTVFPNVSDLTEWNVDCEKIGGTPIRSRRAEGYGAVLKELRAKGIPAVEISPWAHQELGPWGGLIGLVELGVSWSQRLCVPWHRV